MEQDFKALNNIPRFSVFLHKLTDIMGSAEMAGNPESKQIINEIEVLQFSKMRVSAFKLCI